MVREGVGTATRFRVSGLVIGPADTRSRAAHAWGYAEGRAHGPWILRRLFGPAIGRARVVPSELVADWGPTTVRIGAEERSLPSLEERPSRDE
jgi:hypothetical protein